MDPYDEEDDIEIDLGFGDGTAFRTAPARRQNCSAEVLQAQQLISGRHMLQIRHRQRQQQTP